VSGFILPIGQRNLTPVVAFLSALSPAKPWRVTVEEAKPIRSSQQNKYLFGVIYKTILEQGGEAMRGWTLADLHDFFLIDFFGSEVIEVFGKRRHVPLRRSSKLSKLEFANYIAHIQQFMGERGVFLDDPH
jgi:hypothetical protein